MNEHSSPPERKIGFVHHPPPDARFSARLARELDDPLGAARLRWLMLLAPGMLALSKIDLAPGLQFIATHPIWSSVLAFLAVAFHRPLLIPPANLVHAEIFIFELLRPIGTILAGQRSTMRFLLVFLLELLITGSFWLTLRRPLAGLVGKSDTTKPSLGAVCSRRRDDRSLQGCQVTTDHCQYGSITHVVGDVHSRIARLAVGRRERQSSISNNKHKKELIDDGLDKHRLGSNTAC